MGLRPVSIGGASSPFNQWGVFPFHSLELRPLVIDWREDLMHIPCSLAHPPAFYGTQHVWFCPTTDLDLRGWLPVHYIEGLVPFYCVGLHPPSTVRTWVPFQSEGLGPLPSNGVGSPSTLWGRVPFQSVGLGPLSLHRVASPFYSAGLGPLSIKDAEAPLNQWGRVPFSWVGLGPLAIICQEDLLPIPSSLKHLSAFYGAQHVWL